MDRSTRSWGWTILIMAAGLAWLLPAIGMAGIQDRFAPLGLTPIEPPRPAIDFALKDVEGQLVRLSDLRGKVVLVNFEATWCPSCRVQAPKLERLHQRLQGQDFAVLSVHLQERPSTVQAFRQEHGMSLPAVIDADGTVGERYEVQFIPTTYLIDHAGRMVGRTVGPKAWDSEEAKDLMLWLINQP